MKHLSNFSPAETLLLIEGSASYQRDLLKVTFLDLLLKKVIKKTKKTYRPSIRDPYVTMKYICAGPNFQSCVAAKHEDVFLDVFTKSKKINALFKHMVKMGYENSYDQVKYQKLIAQSDRMKPYFKINVLFALFGAISLTREGKVLAESIKKELADLDKTLPKLVETDKQKAWEIIQKVNGNIFLLKNLDFSLLYEIDKEMTSFENERKGAFNNGSCSSCSSWDRMDSDWIIFDSHSHSFDSSCGGDGGGCGSSDGSGCGSGCGGCGGGGD